MPTFPPNATFTSRLQLPRPGLDDVADGPDGFNDLTDVLDPITTVYSQGTLAARPAAGTPGRFYWATDTRAIYYDDGTAWRSGAGTASVGAALPILDVGMAGQIRAGRQLAVADFTSLGLAQPIGLWNLSDLTNLGSDGRALANKGAVPFGVGINGLAATAAVFAGSASQALYIPDSGAADPFRIRTGSWGCWFRTAKRGTNQQLVSKWGTSGAYTIAIAGATNTLRVQSTADGTTQLSFSGVSDVCDDRWHHGVVTHDGAAIRLYADGVLETIVSPAGPLFPGVGPLNIGGLGADASAVATEPHYGRVDEAFVTGDILTDDQVRCLYAARLTHTLGVAPTRVSLNVRRARKGAPLVVGDFTTSPLRFYNFTAGDLAGAGSDTSGNRLLTPNGAPVSVAGADGTPGGAFSFAGAQSLSATDAGLPAALASRSYGCWFKATIATGSPGVMGWGAAGFTNDARFWLGASNGLLTAASGPDNLTGPFVLDGQWHFAIAVEDNAAGDGVRRKLYVDGRLAGGSTVLTSLTLGGAGFFRIGANPNGTTPFIGQIDGAFVTGYALGADDVARLWAKGAQVLGPSPKNAGDHVEAIDATSVLAIFDTLESQHTVDVGVAS